MAEAASPYQRKGVTNVRESYCNLEGTARARLLIEIAGKSLRVFVVGESDTDAKEILARLRSATIAELAELLDE